jgi:hypothetical protein
VNTEQCFLGVMRPERGTDPSLFSNAEVKNDLSVKFSQPFTLSCHAQGQLFACYVPSSLCWKDCLLLGDNDGLSESLG